MADNKSNALGILALGIASKGGGGTPSNMVTTNTEQTITGTKTVSGTNFKVVNSNSEQTTINGDNVALKQDNTHITQYDGSGRILNNQGGTTATLTLPTTTGTIALTSDISSYHDSTKQDTLSSDPAVGNVIAPLYIDTGELRIELGNGVHKTSDDALEVEVKSNGGITLDANGISVDTSVIQPKLTAGTNITIDANNVISASGGSSEGCLKYSEAQSLTDAQFNQVMDNLKLGAEQNNVGDEFTWSGSKTCTSYSGQAVYGITNDTSLFSTARTYDVEIVIDGVTYTKTGCSASSASSTAMQIQTPSFSVGDSRILTIVTLGNTYDQLQFQYSGFTQCEWTSLKVTSSAYMHYTPIDSNYLPAESIVENTTTGYQHIYNSKKSTSSNAGRYSTTYGINANANGEGSVAVGYNANASAYGESIGQASNSSQYGVSIGWNAKSASQSESIGYYASSEGVSGTWASPTPNQGNNRVIGWQCKAYGDGDCFISSDTKEYCAQINNTIIGTKLTSTTSDHIVLGKYNAETRPYADWDSSTAYAIDDIVYYSGGTAYTGYYKAIAASTGKSPASYSSYWNRVIVSDDNIFVIGNGSADASRSNAFVVTKDGNVECNNIPSTSALSDGTYNLQVTITDGVPTFSWVAQA